MGKFTIDPFARHIAVSTQLYRRSLTTRVHSDVFGSQIPGCLFLEPLFFIFVFCLSVFCGELHFIQYVSNELILILRRVLLVSRKHPVFLTRPTCGHLIPHISTIVPLHLCFHLMRFSGSSFIILVCRNCCHHVVRLHSYTFLQGINHHIRLFIAPHNLRNLFIQKGQTHLLPYLPNHDTRSCMVLDPRLIFSSVQSGTSNKLDAQPHGALASAPFRNEKPELRAAEECQTTVYRHKDSWLPRHDLTEVQAGEVSNTWRFCSAVWNVCRSLCSVVNSSHAELGQRRGRFLTRRRSSCNFCGPRGPWHEPNAETCLKDTPNANRGCGFFFNRLAARPATALASNSSSSLDPVVVSFGDLEATIHVALVSTLFVSCCTIVRTVFPNWPKGSMYHMKLSRSAGKHCEKMPMCRKNEPLGKLQPYITIGCSKSESDSECPLKTSRKWSHEVGPTWHRYRASMLKITQCQRRSTSQTGLGARRD